MTGELIHVPFHETHLVAVAIDGQLHVSVRHVCDQLGVEVAAQLRKLHRKPWACVVMKDMQMPGDDQRRQVAFIDRRTLTMWLATIETSRVDVAVRPFLIELQNEAADALDAYFNDGGAINPRATVDQLDLIQKRVGIVQALRGVVADAYLDAKGRILLGQAMGERPELDESRRPLYVHDYLGSRGVKGSEVRAIGSAFGKLLRAAYFVEHADQPPKAPQEIGGRLIDVYAYTEADRHLFDRVWINHYADRLTVIRGGVSS